MDFFSVDAYTTPKANVVVPIFNSRRVKDFMTRGRAFYAVFDEATGLWDTSESRVFEIVDDALNAKSVELYGVSESLTVKVYWMNRYRMKDSNSIQSYSTWVKLIPDNYRPLDQKVTYLSQQTSLKDYASKRLPYDLDTSGEPEAYNEIMSTIYDPMERRKLEWALGAVLNGDIKYIQKMIVLFGPPGSGKSTFLHIMEQVLEGYTTSFDAKALVSGKDFSTHFFRDNPLVAIQHDAVLNKIEDNTTLNSIISHEPIIVNEKHKAQYTDTANCMLFVGTNSPVKITDAKSGLIRRIIDVNPSGRTVPEGRYFDLIERIPFELGRIANHCIKVYRHFGKLYYMDYRPLQMMKLTDAFFNFILDNCLMLETEDPINLTHIYDIYKNYCEETKASFISQRYKFRNELENYYETYDRKKMEFSGFKAYLLDEAELSEDEKSNSDTKDGSEVSRWIVLDERQSIFDTIGADFPAQYGNQDEIPFRKWKNVTQTLKDIDTTKLHYVKVPENHIVIDFDLKNEKGEKDATRNLDAANKFAPTYAEYSKGGAGIHLHYIYDGDSSKLSRIFSEEGIEVKVFSGGSSLRRKLTFCNNLPIAHISSGLPLKEEKKVINMEAVKNEMHLRNIIKKCLRKEVHPDTRSNVDYIWKLLSDAYTSGMHYDVRDMRQAVLTFAMHSTNQSSYCVKKVNEMSFCSEEGSEPGKFAKDAPIVFYDVEVFPNLFLINWIYDDPEVTQCVRMINPSPKEVGSLFKFRLIGFNNRRFDNHLIFARYLGYDNMRLFKLSGRIINEKRSDAMFGEAYNISYTDIYDFASTKQSLKKWQIEMGIHHQELGLPWDQPVPKDQWVKVAEYCDNDVISTRALFHYLEGDWKARQILAALSGLTPNDTTNMHTTRIIFGENKHPKLVYTDLTTGKRYY